MTGYSKTPLHKKLNIKEGFKCLFIDPPENFMKLLGNVPDIEQVEHDIEVKIDYVHFFVNTILDLEANFPLLKTKIKKNGLIWISWHKKSSKKPSELNEDIIRDAGLNIGLVDVKVCAIDDDWSALKFVIPLKDR